VSVCQTTLKGIKVTKGATTFSTKSSYRSLLQSVRISSLLFSAPTRHLCKVAHQDLPPSGPSPQYPHLRPVSNLEPCSVARTFDVRALSMSTRTLAMAEGPTVPTVPAEPAGPAPTQQQHFHHLAFAICTPAPLLTTSGKQQRGCHLTICRCFQLPFALFFLHLLLNLFIHL